MIFARSIAITLVFLAAVIPLLINPFVLNWVELIKRESAYVLMGLLILCAIVQANKKKTLCACIPCP